MGLLAGAPRESNPSLQPWKAGVLPLDQKRLVTSRALKAAYKHAGSSVSNIDLASRNSDGAFKMLPDIEALLEDLDVVSITQSVFHGVLQLVMLMLRCICALPTSSRHLDPEPTFFPKSMMSSSNSTHVPRAVRSSQATALALRDRSISGRGFGAPVLLCLLEQEIRPHEQLHIC